ncbi:MAG: hypothetical protein ABL993_09415 [Vicinamibacterales bacterium]
MASDTGTPVIGVTEESLTRILKAALAAAPTAGAITEEGLGRALAGAIQATAPRRQVTAGEYHPKSSFHPLRSKTKKLKGVWFQNGFFLNEDILHDAEVDLLNRLHRPGRYIDRKVEVVLRETGADLEGDIRYQNNTPDVRLMNKDHWRNFQDMLEQIVTEQDLLDEEDGLQVKKPGAPRSLFSSPATREARERVAAQATQTQTPA